MYWIIVKRLNFLISQGKCSFFLSKISLHSGTSKVIVIALEWPGGPFWPFLRILRGNFQGIFQEMFWGILNTEDGRSTSVCSLYGQLSQGRMDDFPAFIASKSFDLWNQHIPQIKWHNFWHILMYKKNIW